MAEFQAQRKTVNDNVTVQDASATNIPVTLNQLIHTSFLIRDGEESMSFVSLVDMYLSPAVLSMARIIDQIVLGQYPQFLAHSAGRLGVLSSTTSKDYILETRKEMNINKAWVNNRNLIWTPNGETEVLKTDIFNSAEKVGDNGTALREASLGRKLGFDHSMCQNMASIAPGNTTVTGAINLTAGYQKGAVSLTVDGFSAAIGVNSFITVAGDNTPLRVVSTTGGATPTVIVVASPGLRRAVANDAVVTVYTPGQVNLVAGYAAGWSKKIIYDTFTVDPQVGHMISFGIDSTNALYTIIQVDTTAKTILLDRPLEAAVANDAKINISPTGEYNFAFHRNAIALVVRPLAMPRNGTGALSAVINVNGLSMRVCFTYDGNKQGHLVTLDMLAGIKVLDDDLGALLFG